MRVGVSGGWGGIFIRPSCSEPKRAAGGAVSDGVFQEGEWGNK